MVFQDPYGSLNPRMKIRDIVGCALTIYEGLKGKRRTQKVEWLLDRVGCYLIMSIVTLTS